MKTQPAETSALTRS